MCTGNLTSWLDGSTLCPDSALWPTEYDIWNGNDRMVPCGLRLKKHHSKHGPYAQALRLRDLLSFKFDVLKPLASQARQVSEECEHIVAMGTLSAETLAVVATLHILNGGELKHIANQLINAQSDMLNPLTITRIICIMELEQQQQNGQDPQAATPVALAATADNRLVCTNCKMRSHPTNNFFQIGGELYHEHNRLITKIRAHKGKGTKDKGKPSANSALSGSCQKLQKTADGTAYFVHNDVVVFPTVTPAASVSPSPTSTPATEYAGLAESPVLFLAPELTADATITGLDNVPDWVLQLAAGTNFDGFHSANAAITEVAFASADIGDFIFDSSMSIHLSPVRSDFTDFRTIPPQGIKGVNGAVLYATGLGVICHRLSGNSVLCLVNALYVPDATVRLVSIHALCDSPSNLQVTFA
ncbi:hypothetical protein C8Q80DRAFT_1270229 [Daedaleopsis nitida]|nr:hypothetical protein C8Q80DRAFT_1270229 [Daedaleopsis nitida]